MKTTYQITLANGESYDLVLTTSEPSYRAQEYAKKWAKLRFSEVSTVVIIEVK
jgi:hypothetical protein